MQFTRMPVVASSCCRATWQEPDHAGFGGAGQCEALGLPSLPAMEATFTIRARVAREHQRHDGGSRGTPRTVQLHHARHSAGVHSHSFLFTPAMPAFDEDVDGAEARMRGRRGGGVTGRPCVMSTVTALHRVAPAPRRLRGGGEGRGVALSQRSARARRGSAARPRGRCRARRR